MAGRQQPALKEANPQSRILAHTPQMKPHFPSAYPMFLFIYLLEQEEQEFFLKMAAKHRRHSLTTHEISMQHSSLIIFVSGNTDLMRTEGYSVAGWVSMQVAKNPYSEKGEGSPPKHRGTSTQD